MRDKKIAGGPMTFIRRKEFAFKVRSAVRGQRARGVLVKQWTGGWGVECMHAWWMSLEQHHICSPTTFQYFNPNPHEIPTHRQLYHYSDLLLLLLLLLLLRWAGRTSCPSTRRAATSTCSTWRATAPPAATPFSCASAPSSSRYRPACLPA